jgi:hypothetical protein
MSWIFIGRNCDSQLSSMAVGTDTCPGKYTAASGPNAYSRKESSGCASGTAKSTKNSTPFVTQFGLLFTSAAKEIPHPNPFIAPPARSAEGEAIIACGIVIR